jgi:hypothetical protein
MDHECKAYKPWIHENKCCQTCPHLGKCEWTWEGPDIPDLWGFFNGDEPDHEDVDSYFTRENHLLMFGIAFTGTNEAIETMKAQAHDKIEAIQDLKRERV